MHILIVLAIIVVAVILLGFILELLGRLLTILIAIPIMIYAIFKNRKDIK